MFAKAMTVDNDTAPSSAPVTLGNSEESSKKGKAREIKKVSSYLFIILSLFVNFLLQTPEKRPEVRFLEVSAIPGITINPRFQKYLSIKKIKLDHLNGSSLETRSSEQTDPSLSNHFSKDTLQPAGLTVLLLLGLVLCPQKSSIALVPSSRVVRPNIPRFRPLTLISRI
jgi:hypothetical protein